MLGERSLHNGENKLSWRDYLLSSFSFLCSESLVDLYQRSYERRKKPLHWRKGILWWEKQSPHNRHKWTASGPHALCTWVMGGFSFTPAFDPRVLSHCRWGDVHSWQGKKASHCMIQLFESGEGTWQMKCQTPLILIRDQHLYFCLSFLNFSFSFHVVLVTILCKMYL